VKKLFLFLLLSLFLVYPTLAAAVSSGGASPGVKPKSQPLRSGVASMYGPGIFQTASGRTVDSDRHRFTAHKTLPFGSRVLIQRGGKRVVVVVVDRGPYISGRDWDLSYRAASKIGLLQAGVGHVRYRVLSRGRGL